MTILALRALGLGDALTGVPALRGVRRAWPGHRLVLAAPEHLGQWLAGLGLVDAVLPTPGLTRLSWPWNGPGGAQDAPGCLAVNLHGRGPQSHRVLLATQPDALIAFGNPDAGHVGPDWDETEHEVLRWCRLVSSVGGRCGPEDLRLPPPEPPDGHGGQAGRPAGQGEIVVHPGASAAARRWPASRWSEVVTALVAQGRSVTLTGSSAEQRLCRRVCPAGGPGGLVQDSSGRLSLSALAELVSRARLVVSSDTGVAHLATAFGTPSVTLFGPSPPSLWGPVIDPSQHLVIWHDEWGATPRDPNGDRLDPALDGVTADEVVAACESALRQPPATAA